MHTRFLVALTTLLLSAPLAAAQTPAAPASTGQVGGIPVTAVQQQGGQQFLMPISLDLLPYGTVTLGAGRYMISNYEGRGIDIYIYSPQPLRIATYAEMMMFQTQFGQMMQAVAQGSPVPAYTAKNPPLPLAAPAAGLPAPAAAPVAPVAAVPAPAPAPVTALPAVGATRTSTSLPSFLSGFFTGSQGVDGIRINYSLTNRSGDLVARIDPTNLLIQQGDTYLAASLNARDSSGQPGIVPPKSAQIGTITIPTTIPAPVTIRWTVQDVKTGELYPLTYTFVPPVEARK